MNLSGQVQKLMCVFDDECVPIGGIQRRCRGLPTSRNDCEWFETTAYGPNELSVKVGHSAATRSDRIGRSRAVVRLFASLSGENRCEHLTSIFQFVLIAHEFYILSDKTNTDSYLIDFPLSMNLLINLLIPYCFFSSTCGISSNLQF